MAQGLGGYVLPVLGTSEARPGVPSESTSVIIFIAMCSTCTFTIAVVCRIVNELGIADK